MMTHRQRMLMAMRGEMPDMLPYVPRIDLWYNANSTAGTLPKRHKGRTQDEISRAEGWALHKIVPEYLNVRRPEDSLHRAIGIYALKELAFKCKFPSDVEIKVDREGDTTHVEYHTPLGMVSTTTIYTEEMRKAGASITWVKERVIKKPEDYRVVGYIFENLELIPDFDDFIKWKNDIGEDGVAATRGCGLGGASPMHFIQKDFLDATGFYYHYHDHQKEMRALAEIMEGYFNQALKIVADSPAEAVLWGSNFDDMITYPSLFEKEILPWIRKAVDTLGSKGKIVICHCDGENLGLMDLIRDSGMHVAEAVTPYPMTRVKIEEYYRRWSDRLTVWGGIPEILLMAETATDEDLEAYLDHLFKAVAPGRRFIVGIADTTPAHAVFDRVVRIGERIEKEGRLPLEGGAARPISEAQLAEAAARVMPELVKDEVFKVIQDDVLKGNHTEIKTHAQELLDKGVSAHDVLHRSMISAMEVIGERFKAGDVFIPEVLLSARAMNEALVVLEPYLARMKKEVSGKVLIGTVQGDMHDIGKNMVITMLRGVGFEIQDVGVNVPTETIVERVSEYKPDILGLSALLTTTMPQMKRVIDALKASGVRESVKVIVGGAPVNEKFAKDIGADGYAPDAGEAVDLAKKLVKKGYEQVL
ncbi:MAG: cobalamin B12-binding domain-containing protein [Desulfobacterales bacterium]|nr:cobalamin B12-binding domain-containing protein [Desulfobacterales bacterium]